MCGEKDSDPVTEQDGTDRRPIWLRHPGIKPVAFLPGNPPPTEEEIQPVLDAPNAARSHGNPPTEPPPEAPAPT